MTKVKRIHQMEKHIIHPKAFYTPRQIQDLELIPSNSKSGGWTKYETVIRYILTKKLKPAGESMSSDGRIWRYIKGSEIIKFLEKYRPGYIIPVKQ
jgi:hypothetical protein